MVPVKTEGWYHVGVESTNPSWTASESCFDHNCFWKRYVTQEKRENTGKDIDLRYGSLIAGSDEQTENHQTGQRAKNWVVIAT